MMRHAFFFVGLALLTGTAHANEMPHYDVAKHCDEVASFSGATSEMIRKGCFQQEQSAYDAIKRSWTALPASTRAHCSEIANFSGTGSYAILKGCIDMERSAARSTPEFKY